MTEPLTSSDDPIVVIHHAGTTTEAVVIRGLLESAGIASPDTTMVEVFPMREAPEGFTDSSIVVLQSQAEDARRIIEDYLKSPASSEISEDDSPAPAE